MANILDRAKTQILTHELPKTPAFCFGKAESNKLNERIFEASESKATNRDGISLRKGVEADAAEILRRIQDPTLHKGSGRGRMSVHGCGRGGKERTQGAKEGLVQQGFRCSDVSAEPSSRGLQPKRVLEEEEEEEEEDDEDEEEEEYFFIIICDNNNNYYNYNNNRN
jgi:hypothetical protein